MSGEENRSFKDNNKGTSARLATYKLESFAIR